MVCKLQDTYEVITNHLHNNMIEDFIVTIYSVEKWGFAPYCNLNKEFRSKYDFEAYVQLISNIRQSLTSYVTDEIEILWIVQYRTMIKLELFLFILVIILAMGGTVLVPFLYSRKLFGFTLITFGLTFCGVAFMVCCILFLYNRGNGLIKRYKVMIFETIYASLQQLNHLYKDKAIFQITEITSTRSCCKYAVQLDINCRIQLLCDRVSKCYPSNPPPLRVEIAVEQGTNNMYKQIICDVKDDVELASAERSPIHLQPDHYNGDSCSDASANELNVFHSSQTLHNIMDLVNSHNNELRAEAYNLYNLGRVIAQYFDGIFKDTNTVVIVSEKNKQPQLSYVSQKHFEKKVKNVNCNKDLFIYRSIDHIPLNAYVDGNNGGEHANAVEWFQRVVLNLTRMYNSTAKISFELDKIFGAGCHVARAPHNHFNVFSTFSDGLIARCEWKNGTYTVAWRR
eukprot:89022_1